MNKFTPCVAVFLIFFISNAFGQTNVVKAGFSDAFLGNFNLNYEKAVNQNQSVSFKLGYMKPTLSPFISETAITPSAYTLEKSKGGMNASVDYRFYMSQNESLQGLYIAPYMRWLNQKMDYADEIDTRIFDVDFRLNTLGAGAQLGYQLLLAERISLDFYFFGAGIDYHMVHFKYQLKQQEPGFDYGSIKSEVSDVFKNINYLHKKLKFDKEDDHLTTRLPFFFPGFRAGINLGIAF
ncbi:MAG TPA: DUF3575 domain-containing protein [Mariniphaga anaerophila]|uniref:DUF3575 domain-containing protein n=1 Tax=Mariniphaga anaerophila TaxID=1484053 RepID=A0A831PJJ8_9BACT|nr:DUF3575 domain-containing protein [Mariniphaga anaerophila]